MQRFFMSLLKKQCNHNFEFSILNFELNKYEATFNTLGLGALTLFCRGAAIRGGHSAEHRDIHADGAQRRPDNILYLMAVYAVGDKTVLESVPRPLQD